MTKLDTPALRDWYALEAVAQSWGRETLIQQIRSQLHLRQGAAVTNFAQRLPAEHAGMTAQILEDPLMVIGRVVLAGLARRRQA